MHKCYHESLELEVEPDSNMHVFLRSNVHLLGNAGGHVCMVYHKNAAHILQHGEQRFKLKIHAESHVSPKTKVSSIAAALWECFVFSSSTLPAFVGVFQLLYELRTLGHSGHTLRRACGCVARILQRKERDGHALMQCLAHAV